MRLNLRFVLTLLLFSIVWMSCEKKYPVGPAILSVDAFVNVVDEQGNDLLDPSVKVEKSIDISKVQVVHIVGENERIQSPGVTLVKPNNGNRNYSLRFYVNYDKREKLPITLLKWNLEQADTIKSSIYFTPDSAGVFLRQLIHNNVIVWEANSNKIASFTITN